MSSWWVSTPENDRLLAEERAVVEAAELISSGIETTGVRKKDLAARLGIAASELSQRLSGRRNLTIRSLAAMVHELGGRLELSVSPAKTSPGIRDQLVVRETCWPGHDMRYTQTGVAVRGITGGRGAA